MPFDDPVVAGTTLIRAAIRSPDYMAGVSGWTINRDGTAEFNDVTIRGELIVDGANGSEVRILDSFGFAMIQLDPADQVGFTFDAAEVTGTSSPSGDTSLVLSGPRPIPTNPIAGSFAQMFLGVTDANTATPYYHIRLTARDIDLTGNLAVQGSNGVAGFEVFPDGTAPQATRLEIDGDELGFEIEGAEGLNTGAAFNTTSATFVTVTGAPTATFTKKHANTRVEIHLCLTLQASAAGTGWQAGLNLNNGAGFNTSYRAGRNICGPAAVVGQAFDTNGHRVITGVPAGTFTVTPVALRDAGAGTVTWQGGQGYCAFTIAEVLQ